jgi:CRISPR-associated exonuclease Cas4
MCFCPRIPFFYEVMNVNPIMPKWVQQGNKHHLRQIIRQKQRTLKRFDLDYAEIFYEYSLSSEVLGMHGRCDLLLETVDEIVPVEVKLGEKAHEGYVLQAIAYGLVAEEVFQKPFKITFLLLGEKAKPQLIEATPELKAKVIKKWSQMVASFEEALLPDSPATLAQCSQCEFINHCNDRDL